MTVDNSSKQYYGALVAAVMMFLLPSPGTPAESEFQTQAKGTVRGKIELRMPPQIVRKERGARYRSTTSSNAATQQVEASKGEETNVVVYLESLNPNAPSVQDAERAELDQSNATFIPHVLPVVRGMTVNIVNRDKTYHNVFSLSNVKKFNIGRRPTGEVYPVTFEKSGVVQVFCDIHSNMTAFILVLDTPYFTQPAEDGSFIIRNVPSGSYKVNVWHEKLGAASQRVDVQSAETNTVNFILQ